MDVKRVLGSERCYLMTDGTKVPFSEREKIFGKRGQVAEANKIAMPSLDSIKKYGRKSKYK